MDMNWNYPEKLDDIVHIDPPKDARELMQSMRERSALLVLCWLVRAVVVLAKEISFMKALKNG